jgi:hypothetical protein
MLAARGAKTLLPVPKSIGTPSGPRRPAPRAVGEAHGDVTAGEPVKVEGLHLEDDDLLLPEHGREHTR